MSLLVLPDAVKVCRDWLVAQSEVTALVSTRVMSESGETVTLPYVLLARIGGRPPERRRLDRASIQFSCWGANQASASLVARTVRAALHAMPQYQHATAVVSGVDDELGLAWLPDTSRTPPTPRFIGSVAVFLRPVP